MKLFASILLLLLALQTQARRIVVSPSGSVKTIAEGLSLVKNGDTLLITTGTYKESNLVINHTIVIRGEGNPVIDGQLKNEIILIKANGVVVEGLTIKNGGYSSYNDIAALRIMNVRDVVIRNNHIYNTFFGIYSQHGTRCVISGNTLRSNAADEQNSANGIHCWKSDSMQIFNNTISGHRDGIYFEFVTNSLVKGNKSFSNVRYGLHFMFSNDDNYQGNEFWNNGAGVAVMYSHHVTMEKNIFRENWGAAAYGLLLKEISDGSISGNRFLQNSTGILMEGSNRLMVRENIFDKNGWALRIQASCDGNVVERNNFTGNSFDIATNGSLVLNRFDDNYWDKYEGYDLDRNNVGDVPYRPVSIYSLITERNPTALMLFRSFMVSLLDRSEKVLPGLTPENLKDDHPRMRPHRLNK